MLNIGKLSPGAADYYVGEIATSAEDYYTGRGEAPGRWVGSLAGEMGLRGSVDPADFRAILEGRDPTTLEQLVARGGGRGAAPSNPGQASLFDGELLDVTRAAARLGVSAQHVRRLLAAGSSARATGKTTGKGLYGVRVPHRGPGPSAWAITEAEVERYAAEHLRPKARPGYDLTLRPPKSVSVLWALAPARERQLIRDAHAEAVDAVVAYYEAHAAFARVSRKGQPRSRIETDGLVAAAFDHRTSRAGDPLLHTHVVVANLTRTADGSWRAVDARGLFEHGRAAGCLYQAHLRHALTRSLGLRFNPVRNGWAEVDGVPREVVKAFSKRRDEIEGLMAESGYTSARAHQTATLATRQAKDYGVDAPTLESRWTSEARALGFGSEQVAACLDRPTERSELSTTEIFAALGGAHGLTEQSSTFTRADVVEALCERVGSCESAAGIDALADEFLASRHVSALAPDPTLQRESVWGRDGARERSADLARFTTPELLATERRILNWAERGFGAAMPAAMRGNIDAALDARPTLSDEQVEMVRSVCAAGVPAIQPVAGRPGSGKTFAAAACVEAFTTSGIPVLGCAVSATAAAELEDATGLRQLTGRPATTIARLLIDLEREPLPPRAVVFVDEASMTGTRDLDRLARHVAAAGGALKLIGDPHQHGSVDTGGAFRRLVTDQGGNVPTLIDNNRQIGAHDRAAIEEYREGLVQTALERLDAIGRVHRAPTAATSYDAMVTEWLSGYRAGSRDPMIAGIHSVRTALNRRARAHLKADGHLATDGVEIGGVEFCPGDWVIARRNDRRLRSRNDEFVKNGSAGVVRHIDARAAKITVEFHREGVVTLPATYVESGWLEHGYARTTYTVQGATLDRVLYHPADASSFEEGYVALTRGRVETHVFLVDGTLPGDEEVGHFAHEPVATGWTTIVAALERSRSNALAFDADPVAAAVSEAFGGWALRDLRTERRRLEFELADRPDDHSEAIRKAVGRRDDLLAKRHAWEARLATCASDASPEARRIGRRLNDLQRSLAQADAGLELLRERQSVHKQWVTDHREELDRYRLVRHAEVSCELQVRAAARAAGALVGGEDGTRRSEQRWTSALERVAVHLERHGREPALPTANDSDHVVELLGDRPAGVDAAISYDLASRALADLASPREEARRAAEPEVELEFG